MSDEVTPVVPTEEEVATPEVAAPTEEVTPTEHAA